MRVGELSRRSGVSLPSIKYYLREGLLPAGERTGPNQADYGEAHLRRLRLIRALLDVGGLSVAGTRDVLAAVDDPDAPLMHVLGAASFGLPGSPGTGPDGAGSADADAAEVPADDPRAIAGRRLAGLVARRGWLTDDRNPAWTGAVEVLATAERLEEGALSSSLDAYAAAVEQIAAHDVDLVLARGGATGREGIVEGVVVGTVLGDTLLAALRRLAQEDASARRLGPG